MTVVDSIVQDPDEELYPQSAVVASDNSLMEQDRIQAGANEQTGSVTEVNQDSGESRENEKFSMDPDSRPLKPPPRDSDYCNDPDQSQSVSLDPERARRKSRKSRLKELRAPYAEEAASRVSLRIIEHLEAKTDLHGDGLSESDRDTDVKLTRRMSSGGDIGGFDDEAMQDNYPCDRILAEYEVERENAEEKGEVDGWKRGPMDLEFQKTILQEEIECQQQAQAKDSEETITES